MSKYKIQHEKFDHLFIKTSGEVFNLMSKINNFSDLQSFINSYTNDNHTKCGYDDIEFPDGRLVKGDKKFKGDLFEIFAEAFFKIFSSDNRVGVGNYEPVSDKNDNGVDGHGTFINGEGEKATVQVKWRTNPTYELISKDIKQFGFQSYSVYNVNPKLSKNMVIFTNCKGLNNFTEREVFNNKFHVINGEFIKSFIENNKNFWVEFSKLVEKTILSTYGEKVYNKYKE